MKRDEVTGSKFFNAEDVMTRDLNLTISEATQEEFKAEDGYKQKKLVLLFRGTDKKLTCGKNKANLLFDLLGDDTDDWVGQRIRLFLGKTNFQGKRVNCVEVGMPKPKTEINGKKPFANKPPLPDAGEDFDEFADRVASGGPAKADEDDDAPY